MWIVYQIAKSILGPIFGAIKVSIDSSDKRKSSAGEPFSPDGAIDSYGDRRQSSRDYRMEGGVEPRRTNNMGACMGCDSNSEPIEAGDSTCSCQSSSSGTHTHHSHASCGGCASSGQPYYQNVSMCPEDNCKTVYVQKVSQVFKLRSAFVMPACGGRVYVVFNNVVEVAIGSYLWAESVGYLKVAGFSSVTQEVVLENTCPSLQCGDQAAPGTMVQACTAFVVTPPPCQNTDAESGLWPYLAADMVAPANGSCLDIAVTNTNGIIAGGQVTIGGGTYRVGAILSATLIQICNDGAGLSPGTVVDHDDAQGNLIVPIIIIAQDPCLATPVLSGKLLVCKNGLQQPIEGILNGQIPVYDSTSKEVDFRSLAIPVADCTSLTVCLTLDPANPPGTSYLVQVVDTSAFTMGDILSISGTQFSVISVDSLTTMHISPLVNPSAVENFPVGSQICSADCCTQLDSRLYEIEHGGIKFSYYSGDIAAPVTIDGATPATDGPLISETISNLSTLRSMIVLATAEYQWTYRCLDGGVGTNWIWVQHLPRGGDPIVNREAHNETRDVFTAAGAIYTYNCSISDSLLIPPGGSITVQAQSRLNYAGAPAPCSILVHSLICRINGIGVLLA